MGAEDLLPDYNHPSARKVNTVWVEGAISAVDPVKYLYKIILDSGLELRDVRRIASSTSDASLLPLGARVLVLSAPPTGPYICGIISYPPTQDGVILPQLSTKNRRIQPGDNLNYGTAGNFMAALSTGSCVMQSEPMAHISTHPDGHVDLNSRTFSHRSLFGETHLTREGDAVNYSFRGGASLAGDTGPLHEDAWTFRADIGAAANMLDVRVTTPGNQVLGEFYMGSDGAIRIVAEGGRLEQVGGSDVRFVTGDDSSDVSQNSYLTVGGQRIEQYGSHDLTSKGETTHKFLGGYSKVISGSSTEVTAGRRNTRIMGDDVAAVDGSSEVVSAPVYAGALPNPLTPQSSSWINYAGSYNFCVQMPGQAFNVYTTGPASINLGVPMPAVYNPLTGTHTVPPPVALFTPVLLEKLVAWMGTLMTALAVHEHPVAGVLAGPSVSLSAATSTLSGSISTLGSTMVRIGG